MYFVILSSGHISTSTIKAMPADNAMGIKNVYYLKELILIIQEIFFGATYHNDGLKSWSN
jgi:hypothetical protein